MTETQAIIEATRRAAEQNVRGALATVVRVEGSAYRRPGARMFVTEGGERTGILSGGCLEGDVAERALKVIESGEPAVVTYDTTSDDDIVWGLGIGCRGVVQVLIEPAAGDRFKGLTKVLEECLQSRERGATATVIDRAGGAEIEIGARALLHPYGYWRADDSLERHLPESVIIDELRNALRTGVSSVKRFDFDRGSVEVFFEVIEPPVPLVILGAGDDALPLVTLARSLGWHTSLVDTRARALTVDRFAHADEVVLCGPEEVSDRLRLTEKTVVVMMTHNYLHDLELLRTLLQRPLRYLGCLGPRHRTEKLLTDLADEVPRIYPGQLYAPAGLDIGADTPTEVAFSIVAEIKAVLSGREGGMLRKRKGPIHTPAQSKIRSIEAVKFQCEVAVA
jgi:xanthine/CO dehydrogenase XdhC/CoxF family maturation factor